MEDKNSVVAVYGKHGQAEEAIRELQKSGFDMKKLSIPLSRGSFGIAARRE